MKTTKYLLTPLKYLLILLIIAAAIFYRSVIFHPNVSNPIDYADSFLEKRFDIYIPEYTPQKSPTYVSDKTIAPESAYKNQKNSPVIVIDVASSEVENTEEENKSDGVAGDNVSESEIISRSIDVPEPVKIITGRHLSDDELDMIIKLSETVKSINSKVNELADLSNAAHPKTAIKNDIRQPEASGQAKDIVEITEAKPGKAVSVQGASDTEVVISKDSDASHFTKMMHLARKSFWSGDPELSEKYYLDLSTQEDADPNVFGELGNVYYFQGKWKQAGQAYYEAAIRLMELKQDDQVSYLLRVIQGLDETSAEKLRHKMSS